MEHFTKKITRIVVVILATVGVLRSSAQTILQGIAAEKKIAGSELIRIDNNSKIPAQVQFRNGSEKDFRSFNNWIHGALGVSENVGLKLISTESDRLGMLHYRYQQTINGLPVEGTMYIVHVKNNKVLSMNGMLTDKLKTISTSAALPEKTALQYALRHIHAESYRWQSAWI